MIYVFLMLDVECTGVNFEGRMLGISCPQCRVSIEFFLPVTIVIIPDVLVTKLYKPCLVAMASQTMLAGMKFSITGTPNSHAD